jgi:phosphoglycerate kinase
MQAELDALQKALGTPARPVVAIVGGAKISTKLDLLNNLVSKIDTLVLGGGMANTFLLAKGIAIGKSLCEKDLLETAQKIMETASKNNCRILLPVDGITAKEFKANPITETTDTARIQPDDMILDIGPKTVQEIINVLKSAKTVLWNGPVGAFETPPFEKGTVALAQEITRLTTQKLILSVAGGGDTVAALSMAHAENSLTYVSTAGGAFLEWLEGKELPGVKALMS